MHREAKSLTQDHTAKYVAKLEPQLHLIPEPELLL